MIRDAFPSGKLMMPRCNMRNARWPYSTAGNYHVILLAHPPRRLNNVLLFIRYNLYTLKTNAQRKAILRKVGRVGINSLFELAVNWDSPM